MASDRKTWTAGCTDFFEHLVTLLIFICTFYVRGLFFFLSSAFHQCLSVFISGCNGICFESNRVLYISTTCRRQLWNLRDAKIESLAPAARPSRVRALLGARRDLDGYHGPHTENSAHTCCAYPDKAFSRRGTLGRANTQENDARRKNRADVRRLEL